jgi:hypothetical protein
MFKNKEVRRINKPNREVVTGGGNENYIMRCLMFELFTAYYYEKGMTCTKTTN